MTINLHLPETIILKPRITVFGVGGAGGNAVNNMITSNLEGVKFVVANTDAQALEYSLSERKIQLGEALTRGLGAGAAPEVGKAAAEEAMNDVLGDLEGSNMVFITAGMGGGTGTGAAPVIAKLAREKGILTVGVVTKPFHFEGSRRMRIAELGLQELQKFVDTLIIIPNQNLFRIANEKTTFADAFKMADDVLHAGVRGVTDLMMMPGLINLDFADIRTVMSEMGKAMMGTGEAEGEKRALHAAEAAISNPLLDNVSMKGARGVLINITGGMDMTLFEVDEAANRIRDEVDPDANIIFGSTFNPELDGCIRVSVVATGIDSHLLPHQTESSPRTTENRQPEPAPIELSALASTTTSHIHEQVESPIASFTPGFPLTKHNETDEDEEDGDLFIPTRPVEPRTQPGSFTTTSANSYPAPQTQPSPPSKIETDLLLEEKSPEKENKNSFGLFGRMASSVRRTSSSEEEAMRTPPKEESYEEINSSGLREDILDIPAFLRRKTTTTT